MGKFFIIGGVAAIIVGVIFLLIERTGARPGQLPGDISLSRGNWTWGFPIVTCIVVSIVFTIVLNLIARFWK